MRCEKGNRPRDASGAGRDSNTPLSKPRVRRAIHALTVCTAGPSGPQGRAGHLPTASAPSCIPTLPGLCAERGCDEQTDPFWPEHEGDSDHLKMMGGKGEVIEDGKKSSWDVTETMSGEAYEHQLCLERV